MKFNRIGYARVHEGKTSGKKSLRLLIDPEAIRGMADKDIKQGIFLFRNIDEGGKDKGFVVSAPTRDDYKLDHEKLFEKPQQKSNNSVDQSRAKEQLPVDTAGQDLPF